jgi:DNA (cytosine-5)-methyltransferase 1
VPQNRKRNFWVGIRADIGKLFFSFPHYHVQTKLKDILESNVDPKYNLSDRYLTSLKARQDRHSSKGNGFTYDPIDPNGNANTLHVGGSSIESNLIKILRYDHTSSDPYPKDQLNTPTLECNKNLTNICIESDIIRRLTPRECFRLQGFSDTFILPCSDSQLYKQAGNGITVPVVSAIIKEIKRQLLG